MKVKTIKVPEILVDPEKHTHKISIYLFSRALQYNYFHFANRTKKKEDQILNETFFLALMKTDY
jgi:hypothetical protein